MFVVFQQWHCQPWTGDKLSATLDVTKSKVDVVVACNTAGDDNNIDAELISDGNDV